MIFSARNEANRRTPPFKTTAGPAAGGIRLIDIELTLENDPPLFAGLDLAVPAGKTTCVLGKSGVGKSMLLRTILGLLSPDDRNVRFGGAVTDDTGQPLAGRVAYMAQQDLLLPWLSVADNVTLGWRLRGELTAARREQADALLRDVGLGDDRTRFPAALSGGMRQRAALARTLAEDRPFILMDEPFSKLDAITRAGLHVLTARLLEGKTAVLITHDPLEALSIGHQVIVLSGRPARPSKPIDLAGATPRMPDDPVVQSNHAALLRELAEGVA